MGQEELNEKLLNEIKTLSVNVATLTANSNSQAESIKSIQECLEGWTKMQRERDEQLVRHSEKIKTIINDVDELEASNRTWLDRGWNALNTLAFMVLGYFYFRK